jgi:hypothetical protein
MFRKSEAIAKSKALALNVDRELSRNVASLGFAAASAPEPASPMPALPFNPDSLLHISH